MSRFRIPRSNEVDLTFEGDLLADASSQDVPDQRRWQEIRIYRTSSGKYVTEQVGRTVVDGETDRITVTIHDDPSEIAAALRQTSPTTQKRYLTKLALAALDQAEDNDPRLVTAMTEEI